MFLTIIVLLIFESIGTQELLLIGVVALLFLGPRQLPDLARKLGKIMTEFRSATTEFRETWEREVDLEKELRSLDPSVIETEAQARPIARGESNLEEPSVREVDASEMNIAAAEPTESLKDLGPASDKHSWL